MRNYLFLFLLILAQCRNIVEYPAECPALALPQATYSAHVYPIVNKTCAIPQCHTTNFQYGNFNQFEDLKKRADNGKLQFMLESHLMPHGFTNGPSYVTDCEIETIKKWISEGARNN